MDLSRAFKEAVRRQLGGSLIIVDRFHCMCWAFGQVKRREWVIRLLLYRKEWILNWFEGRVKA
ncbi:transposase [Halalkalibacter oceani]|uniref:transposase n=1 Tax=Halalkalibacter oceani TaxID=1653776 RepID=UPI00339537A0